MSTSLYVLRNEATTTAFRHATLDDALAALNGEVGECDVWVLFELDQARVAARRVAEGRGHVRCVAAQAAYEPEPAIDGESAYEWRRLIDRRKPSWSARYANEP